MNKIISDPLYKTLNALEKMFVEQYILNKKFSGLDQSKKLVASSEKKELHSQSLSFRSVVLEECLSSDAIGSNEHKAIFISHLRISDNLNLNYYNLNLPLIFSNCEFSGEISINEINSKSITFENCLCKDIKANNIFVKGSLNLSNTKIIGEIQLGNSKINGNILFSGSKISKEFGTALNMDLMRCEGSVIFDEHFEALGRISIIGSKIGGSIDMHSAKLSNTNNTAFTISNAVIDGNVFLLGKFTCLGRLNLTNTNIKGNLEIEDATVFNPQQLALHADALDCNGSVFIRGGTKINGEIRFPGAVISRMFEVRDCELFNPDRVLFNGRGMTVKGSFEWKNFLKNPKGKIQLNTAKVSIYEDDEASWPLTKELDLNGFEYQLLGGNSPVAFDKRSNWLKLLCEDRFQPQPFENLIKVLKNMGHTNEAIKVSILKQKQFSKEQKGILNKVKSFFLASTMDYGYNPGKIFKLFIIPYLIIGSFVFNYAFKYHMMVESKDRIYMNEDFGLKKPANYPSFNPVAYSIDTFIPFFDLNQQDYWMPSSKDPGSFLISLYLWVHIVSGWLLTSLAVIGYTGLIKKE